MSAVERVFRLSLGLEIGVHALSLLAALEFKQLLQKDLQGPKEKDSQYIRISSAEWCSIAGISERKAYERAKTKLEEQGIIKVEREGRSLRILLWPELGGFSGVDRELEGVTPDEILENVELESETYEEKEINPLELSLGTEAGMDISAKVEQVSGESVRNSESGETEGTRDGALDELPDEINSKISDGTSNRTLNGTIKQTSKGTLPGTPGGTKNRTSDGSNPRTTGSICAGQKLKESRRKSRKHRTPGASKHQSLMSQSQKMTFSKTTYKRYALYHNTINRSSLLNNTKISNSNTSSIFIPNNNNEKRLNGLINNLDPKLIHKNIHKPVDKGDNFVNKHVNISSKFRKLWQGEMGQALTPYQEEGIQRFVRWGFSEDILIEALRCAVMADRKHMGYVLGVLRNWFNQGVRELKDIPDIQQRWRDQRFFQRKAAQYIT